MKNIFIILFLCIFSVVLNAQEVSKQVVASTGNDADAGNYQISQTVGEAMVTTHTQGNYILCQGFQQKDGATEVSIKELNNFKFSYYPNPFKDDLNINFEENLDEVHFDVYTQTGQLVFEKEYKNKQNVKLNLKDLSTGIYFVQFNVKNENVRFQIMKLD